MNEKWEQMKGLARQRSEKVTISPTIATFLRILSFMGAYQRPTIRPGVLFDLLRS